MQLVLKNRRLALTLLLLGFSTLAQAGKPKTALDGILKANLPDGPVLEISYAPESQTFSISFEAPEYEKLNWMKEGSRASGPREQFSKLLESSEGFLLHKANPFLPILDEMEDLKQLPRGGDLSLDETNALLATAYNSSSIAKSNHSNQKTLWKLRAKALADGTIQVETFLESEKERTPLAKKEGSTFQEAISQVLNRINPTYLAIHEMISNPTLFIKHEGGTTTLNPKLLPQLFLRAGKDSDYGLSNTRAAYQAIHEMMPNQRLFTTHEESGTTVLNPVALSEFYQRAKKDDQKYEGSTLPGNLIYRDYKPYQPGQKRMISGYEAPEAKSHELIQVIAENNSTTVERVKSILRKDISTLDFKASISDGDFEGHNLYTLAAAFGNSEVVKQIAEATQSNGDEYAVAGETPLLTAAKNRQTHVVQFLLPKGADANATNTQGEFPLLFAVAGDNKQMVQLLLDYGANPNCKWEGQTPLFIAVKNNYFDAQDVLFKSGKLNIKNEIAAALSLKDNFIAYRIASLARDYIGDYKSKVSKTDLKRIQQMPELRFLTRMGCDMNCPICMSPLGTVENLDGKLEGKGTGIDEEKTIGKTKITACGHTFCSDCINQWTAEPHGTICPVCREGLGEELEEITPQKITVQDKKNKTEGSTRQVPAAAGSHSASHPFGTSAH